MILSIKDGGIHNNENIYDIDYVKLVNIGRFIYITKNIHRLYETFDLSDELMKITLKKNHHKMEFIKLKKNINVKDLWSDIVDMLILTNRSKLMHTYISVNNIVYDNDNKKYILIHWDEHGFHHDEYKQFIEYHKNPLGLIDPHVVYGEYTLYNNFVLMSNVVHYSSLYNVDNISKIIKSYKPHLRLKYANDTEKLYIIYQLYNLGVVIACFDIEFALDIINDSYIENILSTI